MNNATATTATTATTNKSKFDATVYYIDYNYYLKLDNCEIEETYRNFLLEYYQDTCTSPRGVEDRLHIEEEEDIITDSDDGESNDKIIKVWKVYEWRRGNNSKRILLDTFDNEEEAIERMLELYEERIYDNHDYRAPAFFFDRSDLMKHLIEINEEDIITLEQQNKLTARKKEIELEEKNRRQEVKS